MTWLLFTTCHINILLNWCTHLAKQVYFETVREGRGGFQLSRPVDEIIVGDVVGLTKGLLKVVKRSNPEKIPAY